MQLCRWLHRPQMWRGYQWVCQSSMRKWRHLLCKWQPHNIVSWLSRILMTFISCRTWWMPIAVCALKDSLVPTARPTEMTVLQHPAEMEPLAQWVNKNMMSLPWSYPHYMCYYSCGTVSFIVHAGSFEWLQLLVPGWVFWTSLRD